MTTQLPEEGDRDLSTDLRNLLDVLARHETGLVLTLDEVHRRSGADDLAAVEATGGYPFLIQLVGFHVWKQSREGAIDSDAVRAGVDAARRRFGSLVQEPALQDLSDVDRTFLAAMAADDGPTSVSDIQLRMGITKNGPQYVNEYRNRLIKADMIRQVERGRVDYAVPFLREYLRDHAATLGLSIPSQPEEGEWPPQVRVASELRPGGGVPRRRWRH